MQGIFHALFTLTAGIVAIGCFQGLSHVFRTAGEQPVIDGLTLVALSVVTFIGLAAVTEVRDQFRGFAEGCEPEDDFEELDLVAMTSLPLWTTFAILAGTLSLAALVPIGLAQRYLGLPDGGIADLLLYSAGPAILAFLVAVSVRCVHPATRRLARIRER